MKIITTAAFTVLILAVPGLANAQSLQNSGGQQQTNQTQTTDNLQNEASSSIQSNQSGEALTQNQPPSLGVVSKPDQTQPSVTVGQAQTTNKPTSLGGGLPNFMIALFLLVVFGALMAGYLSYKNSTPNQTDETEESPEPETVEPPKKPKKKAKSTSKKKKKAHR